MIDIFSRYVWAIPLCDKEGSTIHSELVKFIMNFGPPSKIQADNGSEFITSILRHTCEVFQIKLVHGRARHPQSQGKIERFNQTLGRHLTKMMWNEELQVQDYRWIDVLPSFVIAYNKVPHEAHKKSPYEVFFGFKMRGVYSTPEDTSNDTLDDPSDDTQEQIDQVDEDVNLEPHIKQVQKLRDEVAQTEEIYRNKVAVRGSVHRKKPVFNPEDKVSIAPDHDTNQKTRKRKLQQTCSMTGRVIGMCSNNRTVRVEVNGEIKNFPAKNLKKLK
jgi:hypothetical protein